MARLIDPITLEVIRSRFDTVAEEMQTTLVRAAYSSVIKAADASAAIFSAQGDTIAQATALPGLLGMLVVAVQRIVEVYPPAAMREGDVYILNDPYEGGTHLPDITIAMPVHVGGEVVAMSCTIGHMQDIGGKVPGSIATDTVEIFQEGLIIPPLKFYEAGQPNHTLHALIRKNVRIPDVVMGDLRALMAGAIVGCNRIQQLFTEYSRDIVLSCVLELFDRAEIMTREAISAIPDGEYTFLDYLDSDGVDLDRRVPVKVTVSIRGSDIHVDFTGTSAQVRGPINCVRAPTMAAVYYVVRAISDPLIPNNAGCYRPISVTLPPGSLVNPNPPAPVTTRSITMQGLVTAMLGALVPALPERIPAASAGNAFSMSMGGINPITGRAFVCAELGTGGLGARPDRDGVDVLHADVINGLNVPVESVEIDFPILVHMHRLRDDSGGAGRWRGGLGYEKVFEPRLGELTVAHRGEYYFRPPWGLFGGLPGGKGHSVVVHRDGSTEAIPGRRVFTLQRGERVHVQVAGGAGYGDPLDRESWRVLDDVIDGKVSLEAAREQYGVEVDIQSRQVNESVTERVRAEKRRERGPISWVYDRGPDFGRE